jgi:hypothetical protein
LPLRIPLHHAGSLPPPARRFKRKAAVPMTHYFLGKVLLASTPLRPWWDSGRLETFSQAFLCPECGDTWGRVQIDGAEWIPLRRRCARHGYGLFLPPWSVPLDPIPLPVLQRDFLLSFEHYFTTEGAPHGEALPQFL